MRKIVCLLTFALSALWAAGPPDVNGTWLVDSAHAGKLKIATLEIRQSGDTMEISEATGTDSKAKTVRLACAIGAEPCKIKEAGEQVSFWFSGPALVMMEMRHGNDVIVKTLLEPSEDGKTLHMQVSHIAPEGKDESYTLTRQGS